MRTWGLVLSFGKCINLSQTGEGVRLHPPNRLMPSTSFGGNHKNDLLSPKVKVGFFMKRRFGDPFSWTMSEMVKYKGSVLIKRRKSGPVYHNL